MTDHKEFFEEYNDTYIKVNNRWNELVINDVLLIEDLYQAIESRFMEKLLKNEEIFQLFKARMLEEIEYFNRCILCNVKINPKKNFCEQCKDLEIEKYSAKKASQNAPE